MREELGMRSEELRYRFAMFIVIKKEYCSFCRS